MYLILVKKLRAFSKNSNVTEDETVASKIITKTEFCEFKLASAHSVPKTLIRLRSALNESVAL